MKRLLGYSIDSIPAGRLLALSLLLALGLTACQDSGTPPPPEQEVPAPPPPPPPPPPSAPEQVCPPDCRLSVTLPADPGSPPEVSLPRFLARAGADVTIELVDRSGRPGKGATVLRFQEPAFANRGGQLMKTVPLKPGQQVFTIRNDESGACTEQQGGCKYDIVNTGEPGRPVLDPHVIIWR